MRIALTSVPVNDPNEALKFYTQVLGFVTKVHIPEASLAIVASSDDPDGTGLLLEPNQSPVSRAYQEGLYSAGLPIIVFAVEDIQREYKRMNNLGVEFKKVPTKTDWGVEAIFDDTFGNLVQLNQI